MTAESLRSATAHQRFSSSPQRGSVQTGAVWFTRARGRHAAAATACSGCKPGRRGADAVCVDAGCSGRRMRQFQALYVANRCVIRGKLLQYRSRCCMIREFVRSHACFRRHCVCWSCGRGYLRHSSAPVRYSQPSRQSEPVIRPATAAVDC